MSFLLRTSSSNTPNTKRTRSRGLWTGTLVGGLVGAFLLAIGLTEAATAQDRDSNGQYQAPELISPASGATISDSDSLRFRWRSTAGTGKGEGERYRRLYQRFLVKSKTRSRDTEGNRARFVRAVPQPSRTDQSRAEPTSTGPYPTVGDWYPDIERHASTPEDRGLQKIRLSYPTVGDWYPGDQGQTLLSNGAYVWEVHLVGVTSRGTMERLASSRGSTFTVDIERADAERKKTGDEQPESATRAVELGLFGLRLTGPAVQATLTRVSSADSDRRPWQIGIQGSKYPVTLRWNGAALADSLPDSSVRLVDAETGGDVMDVNMKANSTAEIANADVTTLQVRPGQVAPAQSPDNVTLALLPKAGAFLSGVSRFGDISGEAGSALGGKQSVFSWGGSLAFGSRNGTVNVRLTGLRTTGSLVSTTEGLESVEDPVPNKLLLLTGDLVLRPIPRFFVQPYAIGGVGARRLTANDFGTTNGEEGTPTTSWDPAAQVGLGADLRLGDVTLGLEIVDYLTGMTGSEEGLEHDAFVFVILGVPIY